MTAEDRAAIAFKLAELHRAATAEPGEGRNEKLAAIARLLLSYPIGNASEEAGVARGGAYLDALDDVPAWAINDAVRRWNRGEAGDGVNYSFAPAPAVLRGLALKALAPLADVIRELEALHSATSLVEAMEGRARVRNPPVPVLRSVS